MAERTGISVNGCKWPKMLKWQENTGYGRKGIKGVEIDGNGCIVYKWLDIFGMYEQGWKLLEMAGTAKNG